jgi:hypothetical protein
MIQVLKVGHFNSRRTVKALKSVDLRPEEKVKAFGLRSKRV